MVLFMVTAVMFCTPSPGYGASLERFVMPGPVSEAHANLEDACANCHSPLRDEPQTGLCVVCHENVEEDLAAGMGFHGRHAEVAENECQQCHTEHEGRDAPTLVFDLSQLNHTMTDFPLLWAHSAVSCEGCHQENVSFHETPSTCVGCHQADDPHASALGGACDDCHTQRNWQETRFNHDQTTFSLLGRHEALSCSSCHENNMFAGTPTTCAACHQSDDIHGGRLGTACEQCHGTNTWSRNIFDHSATGFLLTNGHSGLSCVACHTSPPLSSLNGRSCVGCHASDDVHDGNNGSMCANCHVTTSWTTSTFDHHERRRMRGTQRSDCFLFRKAFGRHSGG